MAVPTPLGAVSGPSTGRIWSQVSSPRDRHCHCVRNGVDVRAAETSPASPATAPTFLPSLKVSTNSSDLMGRGFVPKARKMHGSNGAQSGYLLIAAVVLIGGAAAFGSFQAAREPHPGQPRRVMTLGEAVGQCGEGRVTASLESASCLKDPRSVRRGSGYFMRAPR